MSTPDVVEREHTLLTAAARLNDLRLRDSLAEGLDRNDALELLALGEVLARKATYGRQLAIRSARSCGASWAQIGAALGTTKQAAWEAHRRWIDDLEAAHASSGHEGFDRAEAEEARRLAGPVSDLN